VSAQRKRESATQLFVSHAVADKDIVDPFVNLLRLGCDIREKGIFCSSLGGIPNGEYFVQTVLQNLKESKAAICIVSREYVKSQFCLAELGAAEFRQHAQGNGQSFILMVPPLGFGDLKGILFGVQSGRIDDGDVLESMREFVRDVTEEVATGQTWTRAKKEFLEKLSVALRRRAMQKLAGERLYMVNAELERLTDEVIKKTKIYFPRKFRAIFRNDTGRSMSVKHASLECQSKDARPDSRWHSLQKHGADGAWGNDDRKTIAVSAGETFRVGVAFASHYRVVELHERLLNDELGTLKLRVEIDGTQVDYRKRL